MEKKVIASRIQTPDGTILWSRDSHDYITYTDSKTGEEYMLDGGVWYQHTHINQVPAKNISVYNTSKWNKLRDYVTRYTPLRDRQGVTTGVYGHVRISHMSDNHLNNLKEWLETYNQTHADIYNYVKREIKYREKHNIQIPEHIYQYGIDTAPAIESPTNIYS